MMRVFVAGATGAIGRQLVPRLVAAGHEAHGMTRTEAERELLYELGASDAKAKRELGWQPAHPTWRGVLASA
jgi:NAD(P)-dependent dehydrogenase (short-subunit alcohol dehydrogenase family)